MQNMTQPIRVKVGQYRDAYRWLNRQCKEWDSYFTAAEKTNRSTAVLAQIGYIEQELKRFKTFLCPRAKAHDKEQAQRVIDRASQIVADWKAEPAERTYIEEADVFFYLTYVCEACAYLEWSTTHDCECNDRCPSCNAETEPIDGYEIQGSVVFVEGN